MKRYKPHRPWRHMTLLTAALTSAGALSGNAQTPAVAENLLVSVDATQAALGPLTHIENTGTMGGFFEAAAGDPTVPVVATEGGTKGIRFDGDDFLTHVSFLGLGLGNAPIPAPDGVIGQSPTRSIEVWAYNPSLAGEETLVAWGKRGGPEGTNMSFNYGSDFRWGAVGVWGNGDIGWNNNNGGAPATGKWHHLVYTFDGTTTRVYADGQLSNAENLPPGAINTHPFTAINIGAQWEADGVTVTPGLRFTGTIAKVRVHDGVLTPAQIVQNFEAERSQFIDPAPEPMPAPEKLTKAPVHRYSFSEPAGDATNVEFKDSAGTAHGIVQGFDGRFTGTRLVLPGGPSDVAAYGDLPNGLLSANAVANGGSGQFTFETWVRVTGNRGWSRIVDIGSTTLPTGEFGEAPGPGGAGQGRDNFFVSAQVGGDLNTRRVEVKNEEAEGGPNVAIGDITTSTFGQDVHYVITWDETTGAVNAYENGRRAASFTTSVKMNEINDVNVWLGRSNWGQDPNMQGEFDEVRLYDYALTQGQALGNTVAGPNLLHDRDLPVIVETQPQSRTVPETLPTTFRVLARGSAPISYQWFRNGVAIPGATSSSLRLDSVTAADNNAVFTVEVSNSVNGQPVKVTSDPATLTVTSDTVTLRHRYSFNEAEGSTEVRDSVGSAHGTVVGVPNFANGQLTLDGLGTYVDLPNGIITALGQNGTIEMWITYPEVGPVWTRVFDFGISNAGEDAGAGVDFLFYSPRTGDGYPRFTANFPDSGNETHLNHPGSAPLGVQEHIAITWSATGNVARLYTNGVLVATATAPRPLSDMNNRDVNNWLGRSQWLNDATFGGSYNEFRIYSGALTMAQVAASFQAGPDSLPAPAPKLEARVSGANLIVSWPADAAGFNLEATTALGPNATWTSLGSGTVNGARREVSVPLEGNARFFRLRQ